MKLEHGYRRLVSRLRRRLPIDEAMSAAVGGDYVHVGNVERSIVEYFGLKAGMTLVDIGCGSGRLSTALSGMDIHYLGTDVAPDLLKYAKSKAPQSFRFVIADAGLPVDDGSADMVCAFSLFTHLHHHDSYIYMEDIWRALTPRGVFVFSFLEFNMRHHWPIFIETVAARKRGKLPQHNQFIERNAIQAWAAELGFGSLEFIDGDAAPWGGYGLGQSVVVMRKP